ncbi:FAD-dependent oxidoreductase [Agrobacterium sp. 22-226-1]
MHVIIAGCGIAGPVAAIALQRVGIKATIYERRQAEVRDEGLFLSLSSNGLRALDGLELMRPLMEAEFIPTPNIAFLNADARRLTSLPMGRLNAGVDPITLKRQTLYDVLASEARACGIEIIRGQTVAGFRNTDGVVAASLSDGSEQTCDVLLGADGTNSCIRRQMNKGQNLTRYTGLLNLGGFVRQSGLNPTLGEYHMIWGRRAFFGYIVRASGEAWWFANLGHEADPAQSSFRRGEPDCWKAELLAQFREEPPFVRNLIDATPHISAYPIFDVPTVPTWVDGRVALVGDAAHATSPSSGQGASLAIEDAAYMAVCLREIDDPAAALKHFEATRRPRAEKVVAEGRKRGMYKAPKNAASMFLRDLLMPAALQIFGSARAQSWIYDYEVPQHISVR